METSLTLMMVGDLVLDEPDPDNFFALSQPTLTRADILCGHVEVPHTDRATQTSLDVPAPAISPSHLLALGNAGFSVATLAGNHIYDAGANGIDDTVAALVQQQIATTGAGKTLSEARRPAVVKRDGIRAGFLSYNCVGPRESWATDGKPGCAYVKVITHYELDHATPGGPPTIYTFADPLSLTQMQDDIARLRQDVDVLSVSLHKGIGHTPAMLAMYERPVAQAAIDAGADVVVGHHGHILQGIEVYRGKPIFHGLGNFVTVTRALSFEANSSPARLAWAKRRKELFGFEPDPEYPTYPFHPEAKNAIIATLEIDRAGVRRAGFYPCWIEPDGSPRGFGRGDKGGSIATYVEKISIASGLDTKFWWKDDRVLFLENTK